MRVRTTPALSGERRSPTARTAVAVAVVVAAAGVLGTSCASSEGGEQQRAAPTTAPSPTAITAPTTAPDVTTSAHNGIIALRDDVALVNLRQRDTPFDSLTPWPDGIGYVRAWGGSRGMVTFPSDDAVPSVLRDQTDRDAFDVVNDDEIDGLLELQELRGVQLVYMVNVNDTLESQLAFIELLLSKGIDIAMFEMGTELYLPKFGRGDVTKLGVSRSWSAEEYLELLRTWGPPLRELAPTVPIYGVAAAHGTSDSSRDEDRAAWNERLLAAIDQHPDLVDGVTFHLYGGAASDVADTGEESVTTIDDARSSLAAFGDLPRAITESGYRFADEDPAGLDDAEQFWESLRGELGHGDLFGIHLMFDDSAGTGDPNFALFDPHGRTDVGDRFAAWLAGWASAG